MTALKAGALLWASIMLLMPASNTCSGLSTCNGSVSSAPYRNDAICPLRVYLHNACEFTVLAYSTVTNSGPTTIGGLIGVSPGSAIEGEDTISYSERPRPNGRAGAEAAATAKADVDNAYLDAKGRTGNAVTINVVNIGGLTSTPGLYKTAGALAVSSGTLILSGGIPSSLANLGVKSDGVFIFQIGESFEVSTDLKICLTDGAQAKNVFWQVGSKAVFNTGSRVKGSILAEAEIVVQTGAVVKGRLFSVNSAVTMDKNNITFPSS